MALYTLTFVPYSEMTALSGNPLSTGATTGASGVFRVDPDAAAITIVIDDDDPNFDDGFIDPGQPQILAQDVTVNGQTFLAADNPVVEYEYSIDTTSGDTFVIVRIDGVNVGMAGESLPEPGQRYRISDSDDGQRAPYDSLACFVAGTPILTLAGQRPVETLTPGTVVATRDNGPQRVRWLGMRTVSLAEMLADPSLRPVRIAAGALENTADLRVSPQHRVLVGDWRTQLYFGLSEALIAAKALVNGETVVQDMPTGPVTYVHLAFDRHEVVCSSGLWSESFDVWAQADTPLDSAVRRELRKVFPELAGIGAPAPLAYPVLRPGRARALF